MMRSLLGIFSGGIAGVTMALLGFGVWALVGRQLIDAIVDVVVLWKMSKWRPGFRFSARHCKQLFSFGINLIGFRIVNFINQRSGEFLIGYFLGSVALGYYTIAYRVLYIFIDIMIGAIQKLAFPVFSMQYDGDKLRHGFFAAIEFTTLAAFPVFLGLCALTPEIVIVVFGDQWEPSIPVMQILGLVGLVSAVISYNHPLFMALRRPQWILMMTCLNAISNVVFFVVAVRWGIVAVAAVVLRVYLMSPITLCLVQQILPFKWPEYFRKSLPQLIAGLMMVSAPVGAKYCLRERVSLYLLLPTYIAFGAAIYGITICVIAPQLLSRVVELVRSALPQNKIKGHEVSAFKEIRSAT